MGTGSHRTHWNFFKHKMGQKYNQDVAESYRIHYNFIREHGSIKKTPAEQAGLKLDLGNNKIESLIKLASTNSTHNV